jgi:hypothetical protein
LHKRVIFMISNSKLFMLNSMLVSILTLQLGNWLFIFLSPEALLYAQNV